MNPSPTQLVTSADGTPIAYETIGSGPALVLVDGAMCDRTMGHARPLAAELAPHFTVYAYDRRGRHESGAGATDWSADREIDDLDAVITAAGGTAHVFAASSGAHLALTAAQRGSAIDKLVVYEAPYVVDDSRRPNAADLPEQVEQMLAEGHPERRGEGVPPGGRAGRTDDHGDERPADVEADEDPRGDDPERPGHGRALPAGSADPG